MLCPFGLGEPCWKASNCWCPDCIACLQQGDPFWSLQSLKCVKCLESRYRVLENTWLLWTFVLRPGLSCSSSLLALRGRGTSFLGFEFAAAFLVPVPLISWGVKSSWCFCWGCSRCSWKAVKDRGGKGAEAAMGRALSSLSGVVPSHSKQAYK